MSNPALDPQMQAAIDKMAEAAREQRRWFADDPPALARVEARAIPGPARAIPVRLYVPHAAAGARCRKISCARLVGRGAAAGAAVATIVERV